jgi:hypothetical protein
MSEQTSLDRYALFYEAIGATQRQAGSKPHTTTRPQATSHQQIRTTGGLNQDQVDKLSEDLRSTTPTQSAQS